MRLVSGLWLVRILISSYLEAQEEGAGPSEMSLLRVGAGGAIHLMPLRAVACTPSTDTSVPISGRKATLMTKPGVSEVEKLAPTTGKLGKGRGREGRLKQSHDYLTPGSLVIMCLLQEYVGIRCPHLIQFPARSYLASDPGVFLWLQNTMLSCSPERLTKLCSYEKCTRLTYSPQPAL